MAMTRSMARNQKHHNTSSRKRIKTCNNSRLAPWSDLNHDVLFLVMMQLGVVDFLAFSRVCKSWRSLALSNKNKFIVSRPPMTVSIYTDANEKTCHLEDSEGRKFKTTLPHSAGRICVGLACGYLILFGEKTKDFWLVNPITRHELHFPDVTSDVYQGHERLRAILVFSPSLSEWVFVMSDGLFSNKLWFSITGKRAWTCVSTPFPIHDLHAFNGKIYSLHSLSRSREITSLCELRLYPKPKLVLLDTKNTPNSYFTLPEFVSFGEIFFVMDRFARHPFKIHELDFVEMKWVSHEKAGEAYAFYFSKLKRGSSGIQDPKYGDTDKSVKGWSFYAKMWYFFHNCLNVNLLHD